MPSQQIQELIQKLQTDFSSFDTDRSQDLDYWELYRFVAAKLPYLYSTSVHNLVNEIYRELDSDHNCRIGINEIKTCGCLTKVEVDLTSPCDGTHFYHFPRLVMATWKPTNYANSYKVHVEYHNYGGWGPYATYDTTDAYYTFQFGGANPGRWKVEAFTGAGSSLTPIGESDYWNFTFHT